MSRQRPPDPPVPRRPRRRVRAPPRQGQARARRRAASARPTPTRPPASGCGCRTSSTRRSSAQKLEVVLGQKAAILAKVYNRLAPTADEICDLYLGEIAPRLEPRIVDSVNLDPRRPRGRQAASCSRGPRRRSSTSTTARIRSSPRRTRSPAGPAPGAGVGPRHIDRVIGITKAYLTRVGSGPFPTELPSRGDVGDGLIERGHEFGTNTGRRRRAGWFDLVMLRHAVRLNSLTDIFLTKLDILEPAARRSRCASPTTSTASGSSGCRTTSPTSTRPSPIYEELPGWQTDDRRRPHPRRAARARPATTCCSSPSAAGVPVSYVGVGPERLQTVAL